MCQYWKALLQTEVGQAGCQGLEVGPGESAQRMESQCGTCVLRYPRPRRSGMERDCCFRHDDLACDRPSQQPPNPSGCNANARGARSEGAKLIAPMARGTCRNEKQGQHKHGHDTGVSSLPKAVRSREQRLDAATTFGNPGGHSLGIPVNFPSASPFTTCNKHLQHRQGGIVFSPAANRKSNPRTAATPDGSSASTTSVTSS